MRGLRPLVVGAVALLTGGCEAVRVAGASLSAPARIETLALGSEARPLAVVDLAPGGAGRDAAVVFVTGSGCAGHGLFLSGYFRGVAGPVQVFGLEKPGVGPHDTGLAGCPEAHDRRHSFTTRLDDIRALVDHLAARGFRRIGIVGVSEGAPVAVAAALADPRIAVVTAIGAGPMPARAALLKLAAAGHLPAATSVAAVEAAFAAIEADPQATDRYFLGHTHAWWASQDAAPPAEAWRRLGRPLMVVVGEKDTSWPPDAASQLTAGGAAPGLSVEVVPGADHRLIGPAGDARPRVLQAHIDRLITAPPAANRLPAAAETRIRTP